MNKWIALLATAVTCFIVGDIAPGIAQDFMENPKFLRVEESVLGLNVKELREILGKPGHINVAGCNIPLKLKGQTNLVPVTGDSWIYTTETKGMAASMVICVVNRHAVGEYKEVTIIDGERIYINNSTTIDNGLIKRAFNGELDDTSHEERTFPLFNGPEIEI